MILALLLLLQMNVPDAAQFVGEPKGKPIAGAELIQRTNEVSSLLRCPVCQGMSVADSKAEMAINMKGQVRELLERGYSEEQILSYFEKSYGQFVLLEPKKEGVNWLVWLLPVIALAIGAAVVFVAIRKLQRPLAASQPRNPATPIEDPYVARVRDLVAKGKS